MASALTVWGLARAFGGRVLLRIEDHDQTRSRPEFERAILEDLEWLGFHADEPMTRQSDRGAKYEGALRGLEGRGLVYPCGCSRKIIETVLPSAAGETRYPGTCREALLDPALHPARRVQLDPVSIAFHDLRLGPIEQIPAEQAGDLLARDRLGQWTYQFAVAVDDFDQGIDLVIRGEDLLSSAGRQIQLSQLLGRAVVPVFLHHPLITRAGGQKLSKSNQDTGVRELRAAGWSRERLLGEAASALGLGEAAASTQAEIVARIACLA